MSDYLLLFLILLGLVAAVLRADFVLTVIYLLLGVYALGQGWSRRALRHVRVARSFNRRAFLGEKVPVRLEISNASFLPVVWLQFHESLPQELSLSGLQRRVISLGPREQSRFEYMLEGRRRGYYPIGPLMVRSGDLFGISPEEEIRFSSDFLTVYPRIVPLTRVWLPSRSPLGTLRHHQPVFEDPSRVIGKRDYIAGDSLRRVDWKSTAATGRMQVKLFEPSIALETVIFLNLNSAEYDLRSRLDGTELGIIAAASLANYVVGQRQAVGLATNGLDPQAGESGISRGGFAAIPPRRGRGHLMRILDVLARVQTGETFPLVELLRRELVNLSWGTTLIVITPWMDDELFDGLFQARRAGMNAVLVPCGFFPGAQEARHRADSFGFPYFELLTERDLDLWRR